MRRIFYSLEITVQFHNIKPIAVCKFDERFADSFKSVFSIKVAELNICFLYNEFYNYQALQLDLF